jgi:mannose/fructose/sorbose-specific phosphotransferase system IIA component
VNPMIQLVLASHGQLAAALADTAHMIVGQNQPVHTLSLVPGMGPEEIATKLRAIVEGAPSGSEFLVLMDLFGGSPSTACAQIMAEDPRIEIVTGVNLPMLLEVLLGMEALTLKDLARLAREKGKEGIIDIRQALDSFDP